jgi:hypothetical protein
VDHVAVGAEQLDTLFDVEPMSRAMAGHLLVEGALAQNRLGLAGELAARLGPPPVDFLADGTGASSAGAHGVRAIAQRLASRTHPPTNHVASGPTYSWPTGCSRWRTWCAPAGWCSWPAAAPAWSD